MEHEQRSIHEPSSSTTAYCSTLEELDGASSSVCTSVEESTSCRYWTSIESASDTDDEGYVHTVPGRDVQKHNFGQIKLLEKIGEGGQGKVYTAQLSDYEMLGIIPGIQENTVVAKEYKGRSGKWPEDVFRLHLFNKHICPFYGYCLETTNKVESFYLLMPKFDHSLRGLLDLQMENQCRRRPFSDIMTLVVIIQIALGMCFLHKNNIIHRDLKADNVFVTVKGFANGVIPCAYIGDFDVSSKVVGTLFWRAPEILQALKDGGRLVFTPKADVYSFAMTCYEILTGGVPLKEELASNYDAVLQHSVRPKLPSNLNPKFKNFIRKCWHQDPRPTFEEIVVELKELHRELIIGSESFSRVIDLFFSNTSSSLDIEASPEACLLELKALLQALLVKYGQQDFLLLGLEIVADLEQYQLEFGLRSFKEHPVLPYPEYFKRDMLHDRFRWKLKVFGRINPLTSEYLHKINPLLTVITSAVSENSTSMDHRHTAYTADQSESEEELLRLLGLLEAWDEEYRARVLPESRHAMCLNSIQHKCDVCKSFSTESMNDLDREEDLDLKSCLYVENDLESLASSLRESIGALPSLEEMFRAVLLTMMPTAGE